MKLCGLLDVYKNVRYYTYRDNNILIYGFMSKELGLAF